MGFLTFSNRVLTTLFLAGATLMLLFIVFSGSVKSFPFDHFYFVQVDTSSISNAGGDITRWTFWGICHPDTFDSGAATNCPSLGPDYPISPYDNFGNSTGLPQDFVVNENTYYYLSRFSFPLLLIALIFSGVSFIGSLVAPCWTAMRKVITFFVSIACLFCIAGAACATAVSTMVKHQFSKNGYRAKIDASVFGMMWASVACLLILFFLTCCSTTHRMYKAQKEHDARVQKEASMGQIQPQEQVPMNINPAPMEDLNQPQHEGAGIRFFKIRRDEKKAEESSIV